MHPEDVRGCLPRDDVGAIAPERALFVSQPFLTTCVCGSMRARPTDARLLLHFLLIETLARYWQSSENNLSKT